MRMIRWALVVAVYLGAAGLTIRNCLPGYTWPERWARIVNNLTR